MHTSEGFEPRKVIEVKEEDGYEENVKEVFAVAASDKDDGKVWNLWWKFWPIDGFLSVVGEGGGYFLTTTEFIVEIFCKFKNVLF